MKPTQWLYYSGNSVHPFFKAEFNALKQIIQITASNNSFSTLNSPLQSKSKTQDSHGVVHKYKPTNKVIRVLRWCALEIWCWLGLPKVAWVSNHYENQTKNQVNKIWSCGYLILNKPYVVTFEDSSVFFYHRYHLCNSFFIKLWTGWLLSRKNCLAIVPWTNAAKKSFQVVFPSKKLAKKTYVLYPTIKPIARNNRLNFEQRKNILFVGQAFVPKGGFDLLYAMQRLPNIKADIVSVKYPKQARELAARLPNVTLHENITRAQLEKLQQKAKIFVLPTHMDTLGFSYLEAMSYGTPCIGVNHFATPEIITDGKTGFIAPTELSYFDKTGVNRKNGGRRFWKQIRQPNEQTINSLVHAIKTLFYDEKVWTRMSQQTIKDVESGKFSQKAWSAKVNKITKIDS